MNYTNIFEFYLILNKLNQNSVENKLVIQRYESFFVKKIPELENEAILELLNVFINLLSKDYHYYSQDFLIFLLNYSKKLIITQKNPRLLHQISYISELLVKNKNPIIPKLSKLRMELAEEYLEKLGLYDLGYISSIFRSQKRNNNELFYISLKGSKNIFIKLEEIIEKKFPTEFFLLINEDIVNG